MRAGTPTLDWGELQTFLAICGTGAIARAAARLGVRHATVVRRLTSLESKLGAALFERHRTHYALTPAGRAFASHLDTMAPQIEGAVAAVRGTDAQVSGLVRLATTETLLGGLLGPHLRAFCAAYPGVRLEVCVRGHADDIARRDADVAVRAIRKPPDHLIAHHVGDVASAPYASAAYLRNRNAARPEALDWIAPDGSLSYLEPARWSRDTVPDDRVVLRIDTLAGMVHAVANDLGAAWLPVFLAERHEALVPLPGVRHGLHTPVWVLLHPDARRIARLRSFARAMVDGLRAEPRLRHPQGTA